MSREREAAGAKAKVLAQEKEPTRGQIAAVEGADPDRLLDGEDPETLQVHDADHWIRVYQDLLAFKRQLLATANEIVPDMADAARDEVGKTDLMAMDAEARKFQRRLHYWQQRRGELAARR
jgi:hypothetical protein